MGSWKASSLPPLLMIRVFAEQDELDVVLDGPYTRKVRVLSIGAGVTGIMK